MGLFSQFKRSKDKSILMAHIIDSLKNPNDIATVEIAIKEFYDYIYKDYILGEILFKYDADYETIKTLIMDLNKAVGGHYGGWQKGQYIPVSTFGFAPSLECVLKEYREGSSMDVILYEVEKLM